MTTFGCMWNGRECEVQAKSLLEAKLRAIALLKVPRKQEHMVIVLPIRRADGSDVVHSTCF